MAYIAVNIKWHNEITRKEWKNRARNYTPRLYFLMFKRLWGHLSVYVHMAFRRKLVLCSARSNLCTANSDKIFLSCCFSHEGADNRKALLSTIYFLVRQGLPLLGACHGCGECCATVRAAQAWWLSTPQDSYLFQCHKMITNENHGINYPQKNNF